MILFIPFAGHPGNMAVVLFAMGLYGSGYLGWQIRTSGDTAMVAKAKALHPKVAGGMAMFFAIGALGGLTSLLVQVGMGTGRTEAGESDKAIIAHEPRGWGNQTKQSSHMM